MLWDAGQQRVNRESRDRLAELYVGVRDGYVAGNVATGRAKPRGDSHVPSYARAATPPPSAGAQRAAIHRLATMFPGAVRRSDS